MRIATIGAGYVGLVTGTCLADFGHTVTCVDVDEKRLDLLRSGQVPIFEPGLDTMVSANAAAGRLFFTSDLARAVSEAEVVFIAVGTPSRHGDGHADLGYVYDAARAIAVALDGFTAIVVKSTVPVGTGDEVQRIIAEAAPGADFEVISNPEFLREGAAIEDFKHPDRIVLGVETDRARDIMAAVYQPLFLNWSQLVFTSRRSSELIKYAANSFLAMKITFINEMSDLSEAVGGDIQDVARGIGLDPRIGDKFLSPGPGYGGSCFPKDTLALSRMAELAGVPSRLVEATIAVNTERKHAMAARIVRAAGGDVRGKTVTLLGLTFKANTDDMRDAPAIDIIRLLLDQGASVRAFDPHGMPATQKLFPAVAYGSDPYDAAQDADVLAIVTEWEAFRALDFQRLKQTVRRPVLIDFRNIYRPKDVTRAGFEYHSLGRAAAHPDSGRRLRIVGE
ncbi:MAG: UDP-glucose/GDP-mannose dehydrogenase family protein [Devosia sp.]